MANYRYETVNPSPIENATVQKAFRDGVFMSYRITPNEGYVLRDNARDEECYDPERGTMIKVVGYTRGVVGCGASYDFSENKREFSTELTPDVREDLRNE